MDKNEVMSAMNVSLDNNLNLSSTITTSGGFVGTAGSISTSAYNYWQDYYYPAVIRESYPVYIKERAEDKGRQAYEIIKHLQDKKLMNLPTVKDFIDAMDILLKIL